MQLTFLSADTPLTKTYERRPDGSFVGGAYPGVTNFTSYVEEIDSVAQFAEALENHASIGRCLLTNSLTRAIKDEPRRELSDKNERRSWILLDIDGIDGVASIEDFIRRMLPQPFHEVSYVVQYSPSHGIKPGVRAHLFFMLYDTVDPRSVESWLAETNLATDSLSNQVTLSKSNLALNYPLDRVASRNGRIVYITAPECIGFEDLVTDRIQAVEKSQSLLSFNFASRSPSEISRMVRNRVNTLRAAAGLKVSKKEEHYRVRADGTEIIDDSLVEQGIITGWKEDNDRFMRCNLNGGDSYAYFYHRDQENPYLHNFKGEPSFRLRLFDPQYFAEHVQPHCEELLKKKPRPFVFRDDATDKWFMGARRDEVIQKQPTVVGSSLKIEHYFSQYGTSPPAIIESWDRIFDPSREKQWCPDVKEFNTWRPTEYQQNAMYESQMPATIEKVIRHVTGSDEESYDRFINWLAYVQQTRKKAGTAWVLHGVPGTGKGLLFNYILTPIFGRDYCQIKQIRDLKDKFNGWMEQCILCNIDEANTDDLGFEGKEVISSLKNWITEPYIGIRHMQSTAVVRNSFVNFIFTTNDFGVLPIQDGDRRINVAPRQTEKLVISNDEISQLKDELQRFTSYLSTYKVNHALVIKPLENKAKDDLKTAARTSIEEFFYAAQHGNLFAFIEGTHEDTAEYTALCTFKEAVTQWVIDAKAEEPSLVTPQQLKAAHVVMCRDKGIKLGQFQSMCAKRGFPVGRPRIGEERRRGWKIDWSLSEEEKRELKMHLKPVPTPAELEAKIKSEISGEQD